MVDDGWVWIFAAVEHWNAECVGWHAGKVGSRFAALEPIAQGLQRIYGWVDADVARGLALRMDHGSQYLSDHFLNQIRYWGVRPSFGFVEEPETNGVVERWNRTLKEQAIHGRIFQNLEAVPGAGQKHASGHACVPPAGSAVDSSTTSATRAPVSRWMTRGSRRSMCHSSPPPDICQQRESGRGGPQGLFHTWRRCRVPRHDSDTMPSIPLEVKQNVPDPYFSTLIVGAM